MKFQLGQPKPPNSGRKPGQRNQATLEAQKAVRDALGGKSIVERLMEIAKESPAKEQEILLAIMPYVSPKLTAATVEADVTNHDGDKSKVKELADEYEHTGTALSLIKPERAG